MGRWSQYDTDEERLPEGMTRIGYDADEQTYTYRDEDGSIWESAPGNQYGPLTRISGPPQPQAYDDVEDGPAPPFERPPPYEAAQPKVSWRYEMMPLFNFLFIMGLVLIGVYFFLGPTTSGKAANWRADKCGAGFSAHHIQHGDTCWAIAEKQGVTLHALQKANKALDCDSLQVGDALCVPKI